MPANLPTRASVEGDTAEPEALRARVAALEAEVAALRSSREPALFEATPNPYLLLAPDAPAFTIVGVNDAYARATLTKDPTRNKCFKAAAGWVRWCSSTRRGTGRA